jgi:AsmA-like C-terminal region
MASTFRVASPTSPTPSPHGSLPPSGVRKGVVIIIVAVATILLIIAILCIKYWPFSEKAVLQDLAEASDSTVTIRRYHPTYFPVPGCVLEGVEFRHGPHQFEIIAIDKLRIQGSYMGVLTGHVPRVTAIAARVLIPPFGAGVQFHSQHSNLVVDELVANGTKVEFESSDAQRRPFLFDVHEALLRHVRWGSPIEYRMELHNPNPPGEIAVTGQFGPWADGHPQDTPLSGTYTFEHADLSVYGGIAGILSSTGNFEGVFKHINALGATETPDFVVTSGGHKHSLSTHFDAYVDAMRGDTFLNRVEVRFGRTTVFARGSVAGSEGRRGKVGDFHFSSRHGRIEDILGPFVSAPGSPMSGDLSFTANAQLPQGDQPFLERVRLQGKFGVDDGSFRPETQKDVNALSAGARGQNKEDPETVLSNLKGAVDLSGGIAYFSDLQFDVPGASARLHDTYNIVNHRINLHGDMKVDTKISKTSSGAKSLLLKIMDPLFHKNKKGEIVPVHILGTYEKPQFGLDLTNNGQKAKEPEAK